MTLIADRVEILLLARRTIPGKTAPGAPALAKLTQRFRPTTMTDAQWRDQVSEALGRLPQGADELVRRVGAYPAAKKWELWADKLLPALGLGLALDDSKALRRLGQLEGWTSAIAARVLGLWRPGPPSFQELCDALVWRELGLAGAPEACPPGIRAHFLRKHTAADGTPAKLIRQIASQAVGAPRIELAAIRDSLVRCWLAGREPGAASAASAASAAPTPLDHDALIAATRDALPHVTDGVSGDRKVFIAAAWRQLRAQPAWSALTLDAFKAALLVAHRQQALELVRADLVWPLDPALVAASETRADGTTFHFVLREPPQ